MYQPIYTFISKNIEIFSFQKVEADVYEITRDGKLIYGLITYEQGITYMKQLQKLFVNSNKITERERKN